MNIKLNDGTILDCIVINGSQRYFQGANRSCLEFQFSDSAVTFAELESLFGDSTKTSKITIVSDGEEYLNENYVLRAEMKYIPYIVEPETGTTPEVTEQRFIVTMAQKTYAEKQLEDLQAKVNAILGA